MIVNTIALASILAILECASASALKKRQVLKDENITNRLQNATAMIGDQCHPPGTYALGGDKVIPPCLAEQAISLKCEIVTQAKTNASEVNWKAYRSCMGGDDSSYFQDVSGCLDCKSSHNHLSKEQVEWFSQRWTEGQKAFLNDAVPNATVWEYVQGVIGGTECQKIGSNETIRGWNCWNQLPAGTGIATKNLTIEEYYKNRPKTQNIGSFSLAGKKYPETSSVELGFMVPTFQITSNMGYFSSVKIEESGKLTSEHNVTTSKVETLTEYREIKSICNFTKPDEFTILPIISAPVPVRDSVAIVPKVEAAKLPTAACDGSCRENAPTIEKIQEVAAQGPQQAEKAVAEAAIPAMKDLENNQPLSSMSKITIITEISTEIVAPASFKGENSLPPQNSSGPSRQDSSEPSSQDDSCGSDNQTPTTSSPASGVDKNSSKQASGPNSGENNAAGPTVKVTVCKMPGEKDCKTFFY